MWQNGFNSFIILQNYLIQIRSGLSSKNQIATSLRVTYSGQQYFLLK